MIRPAYVMQVHTTSAPHVIVVLPQNLNCCTTLDPGNHSATVTNLVSSSLRRLDYW